MCEQQTTELALKAQDRLSISRVVPEQKRCGAELTLLLALD